MAVPGGVPWWHPMPWGGPRGPAGLVAPLVALIRPFGLMSCDDHTVIRRAGPHGEISLTVLICALRSLSYSVPMSDPSLLTCCLVCCCFCLHSFPFLTGPAEMLQIRPDSVEDFYFDPGQCRLLPQTKWNPSSLEQPSPFDPVVHLVTHANQTDVFFSIPLFSAFLLVCVSAIKEKNVHCGRSVS